jgi:hypothetical protein
MLCKTLDCFFGAIRDGEDGYCAVQVYRDGNPIVLGHFDDQDEAEAFAMAERDRQLADHGQFGVGA